MSVTNIKFGSPKSKNLERAGFYVYDNKSTTMFIKTWPYCQFLEALDGVCHESLHKALFKAGGRRGDKLDNLCRLSRWETDGKGFPRNLKLRNHFTDSSKQSSLDGFGDVVAAIVGAML